MTRDDLIDALRALPANAAIDVEVKREMIDVTSFGDQVRRVLPGATHIAIAIDRSVDTSAVQRAVSYSHARRIQVDD